MSKIKETKEELIAKNAELKHDLELEQLKDQRIRKEFAIVFNWPMVGTSLYDRDIKPILVSWEKIFTEVGKLLSAKNFYDFEGNISELEFRITELERKNSQDIEKRV